MNQKSLDKGKGIKTDYSQMVIKVREILKETQQQFGERFGLSMQTISHIEKGYRKPNPDIMFFIGKVMGHAKICDKCEGTGWLGLDFMEEDK